MLDRPWVPHTYLENQRRWVAIRQMLVREQDGLCAICGQPMKQGDRNIDHVWPRGAGGYHHRLRNHPTRRRVRTARRSREVEGMSDYQPYIDANGIIWTNIRPLNLQVVPGLHPIPEHQRPGYVKFVPTPPPEPPRSPYAGGKR